MRPPGARGPQGILVTPQQHPPSGSEALRAARMVREMEYVSSEDRLKEPGLFSLGRRRLRGELINVLMVSRGCSWSLVSNRTRGDGHKQEVLVECVWALLYWEATEHQNGLSWEVLESPSPEISKNPPGRHPGHLCVTLLGTGLDCVVSWGPFQPQAHCDSVILCFCEMIRALR